MSVIPKVSVIIPTFNYARYISDAIYSVLKQDYPVKRIEIIVIDDGSTDNTKEVLQPFIDEGLITYHYQKNQGKANATFSAICKCKGKYVFNLDADDYFLPDKVSASVKTFETYPSVVHVASPAKLFNQETGSYEIEKLPLDIIRKPLEGKDLLHRLYKDNILFGGGTTYAARACILKQLNIPDAVDMYIDEFLLLAVLPFGKSFFIEQPLSVWRIHRSNYSAQSIIQDERTKKAQRMEKSSEAILSYLQQHDFSKKIIKMYRLQNASRRISSKEDLRNKSIRDIIEYSYEVFFKIRPSLRMLGKYRVANRLIPTVLLQLLKTIKTQII
jgi:glycosyltransferase involved in cell wall biosynthesis